MTMKNDEDTLTFPVHYSDGVKKLKEDIRSLEKGLQTLLGDVKIMFPREKTWIHRQFNCTQQATEIHERWLQQSKMQQKLQIVDYVLYKEA